MMKVKQCWAYDVQGRPTLYVYARTKDDAIRVLENGGVIKVDVRLLAKCDGPNPSRPIGRDA